MPEHSPEKERAGSTGEERRRARPEPEPTAAEIGDRSSSDGPSGEASASSARSGTNDQAERDGPGGAAGVREESAVDPTERLTRERDEYLETLKRERASFLNYKRSVERERKNWETASVCRFVEQLLPFIDDMDRALTAAEEATDVESLREGFEMICGRFRDALNAAGVEEVPSNGQRFDPKIHEAILQVEDPDQPSGTVLQTTHRGFRLNDRLIRAAKVVVSKGPQPARDTTNPSDPDETENGGPEGVDAEPGQDRGGD
jgi:molecular chaperone GrpE